MRKLVEAVALATATPDAIGLNLLDDGTVVKVPESLCDSNVCTYIVFITRHFLDQVVSLVLGFWSALYGSVRQSSAGILILNLFYWSHRPVGLGLCINSKSCVHVLFRRELLHRSSLPAASCAIAMRQLCRQPSRSCWVSSPSTRRTTTSRRSLVFWWSPVLI
jgi:hypothetical protein